jgi:hypothetical protein
VGALAPAATLPGQGGASSHRESMWKRPNLGSS